MADNAANDLGYQRLAVAIVWQQYRDLVDYYIAIKKYPPVVKKRKGGAMIFPSGDFEKDVRLNQGTITRYKVLAQKKGLDYQKMIEKRGAKLYESKLATYRKTLKDGEIALHWFQKEKHTWLFAKMSGEEIIERAKERADYLLSKGVMREKRDGVYTNNTEIYGDAE